MIPVPSSGHKAEALLRASQHWQARHQGGAGETERAAAFTVALSRETGARGTSVARALGQKLGWPVYDHELLELIAKEMKLRTRLLESVDERRLNWIQDTLAGFALIPAVSQGGYVRHLVETLLSLATHGACVIVGRGAPHLLPAATTLRVRLVAPVEDRIAVMSRELHVSREEAARHVKTTDRERASFVRDHFQKDTTDPGNYDLVLNSARFSVDECADLLVNALRRLQNHAPSMA
jgi:cytidylate kinase